MAIVPFHIVDAFAERPFAGNPAAIISNAASLSEVEMLQITDELSMEAGFVLPPSTAGADLRLRFFTRRREAALSGHVAIAAMTSLVDRGFYNATPEGLTLRMETGAGVLPVTARSRSEGPPSVTLGLPEPRFGEPVPAVETAAALGLAPETLQLSGHGPQRISCGFDQIVVPVADRIAMRGSFREMGPVREFIDRRGVGGVTLVCPDTYHHTSDFHCRFFHPGENPQEDIASGTCLGAAAAWIASNGLLPGTDRVEIVTEQGHSRGRPGTAELAVRMRERVVVSVELTTTGIVVMRGSFHFHHKAFAARH